MQSKFKRERERGGERWIERWVEQCNQEYNSSSQIRECSMSQKFKST
jgi:hypothetical protein